MIKRTLNFIIFLVMFLLIFNCNFSYAQMYENYYKNQKTTGSSAVDEKTPDDIITGADNFLSEGEKQIEQGDTLNQNGLVKTSDFLYNIILSIAMIIAVAIGITIGIKFMLASTSEKAEIKELLVPYVMGCIVVFGAMGIWKLAVNVFSNF